MVPTQIIRRALQRVGVPGLAVVVVGVALTGGALSGWMEHGPVTSPGPPVTTSTPPSTSTSTTSTLVPDTVDQVKRQIVDDLGIDLTAQRLDPDLRRRQALATSPPEVAFRQKLIQEAWAPDQVARIEADYDQLVISHASNPTVPSVTDATFVVTGWQSVTVEGASARAVVVGHFRLHEPGNVAARKLGGYVEVFDRSWTVAVRQSGGRWRMEGRTSS